ncbi:MAG: extracellular catalytic domain type 1 short-chain-length polyhydroxyalkanoate depolymerase [Sphingomicrobium sp.]
MRRLHDTISRLGAMRRMTQAMGPEARASRLDTFSNFGSNPGRLAARFYLPAALKANAPLVVVLHGCTQTADVYDQGSGWSTLANQHGFAVLYPEQRRANNSNLCFNWYSAADTQRGRGEALSIRQMVAAMVIKHRLDPSRVFITGLSAGGAMTSVMLAVYPEVFAGGSIIAGLPFGSANSVPEAFERMRGNNAADKNRLSELVATASQHRGPWPTISVWHGSSDRIVVPANADAIVEQWRGAHGVGMTAATRETIAGHTRKVWTDASGREVIEQYVIGGMGHGVPIDTRADAACGTAGAHMLEAEICSTRRIAQFWGVAGRTGARTVAQPAAVGEEKARATKRVAARRERANSAHKPRQRAAASHITKVIEDALRAAGLMR